MSVLAALDDLLEIAASITAPSVLIPQKHALSHPQRVCEFQEACAHSLTDPSVKLVLSVEQLLYGALSCALEITVKVPHPGHQAVLALRRCAK